MAKRSSEWDRLKKAPAGSTKANTTGTPSQSRQTRFAALRTARIPDLPAEPPAILPRVLFIDDERLFLEQTESTWRTTKLREHARFEVFHYRREKEDELVARLADSFETRQFYDAVYVDLNLIGSNRNSGLGLIQQLRDRDPRLHYIPFVAVTSFPDYAIEAEARERGAVRFLQKTEGQGAADLFGIFVHRMIVEARETLEQSEDQLWADASQRLAARLRLETWQDACRDLLDFLQVHFTVKASFARELTTGGILRQIHAHDRIEVNTINLRIADVPFIRDFMHNPSSSGFALYRGLRSNDLGGQLPQGLVGLQAALAIVANGNTPYGLLSLYRDKGDRPFRQRDARGLRQLAMQLAAAIGIEHEKTRLRARQKELLAVVRDFDQAPDEPAVHVRLQQALFEQIGPGIPGGFEELKVSVRCIRPGTNLAERASPAAGFSARGKVGPISLELYGKSAIARAVWSGRAEYEPDVSLPDKVDDHILVDTRIRASVTIPLMAEGVCFGVASLECQRAAAFSDDDTAYAEQLCLTAAEALLRLRTRRFGGGMAGMAQNLAEPGRLSIADLVRQVVRLLTDFTHCSEIMYLVPPRDDREGAWTLQSVFAPSGDRLDDADLEKWKGNLSANWSRSYVRRVLMSGKPADWSQEVSDLPINDIGLPGRSGDQTTRSQAVIVVRPERSGSADAMIALLFQHRHAVSSQMVAQLAELGRLLASLLMQEREFRRLHGLSTVNAQEARLGRVFAQFRHSLKSRLAKIGSYADYAARGFMSVGEASANINALLTEIDRDTLRSRALVKVPKKERVELGLLWNKIADQLAAVAAEHQAEIARDQLAECVLMSDTDFLESIIYNLVDNAVRHGGKGVRIDATFRRAGGPLTILIRDNGRGIPDDVRARLFELGNTTSSDSTGMGLYLSRERAEILGAELRLERTGRHGTHFSLRFADIPT